MKIKKSITTGITLLLLLTVNMSVMAETQLCEATSEEYSPAMIAELGEAATMLIYCQIDADIKIYIPDANWTPTTTYFTVPVSVWTMSSGFFVSEDGYLVTAGHSIFCFTHKDITQDLETKYLLIEESFVVIIAEFESLGYYFTPEEQAALLDYIIAYGEIKDSVRQVYAVLGEVKPTLTDVQSKGWTARVIDVSPFYERDIALLKVELSNCPVLLMGDSALVMTASDVYTFGFADVTLFLPELGVETLLAPSMKEGRISQKRLTYYQTPCFETSALLTYGMSGGPGLNDKGEVIGVCSMGVLREGIEVAGFNFLIESNVASSILDEANVKDKNEQGPVDQAFTQGLQYFYEKHYSAAKEKFTVCTGLFDYHWRAQALIKECNAAIARGEDVSIGPGIEIWTLIVALMAVVAVAAVSAMILVQRRKARSIAKE